LVVKQIRDALHQAQRRLLCRCCMQRALQCFKSAVVCKRHVQKLESLQWGSKTERSEAFCNAKVCPNIILRIQVMYGDIGNQRVEVRSVRNK
jgi:hypothetical protein